MNKEQEKVWEILENGPKTWAAEVIEDPDDPTQYILTIPPELLERMGWSEGDLLDIDTTDTGCIILSKI